MASCSSAASRLPSSLHRLVRSPSDSSASRLKALVLPPAFLAPRIHAQPFSVQSPRPANTFPERRTSPNSAQNLRSALRRVGLNSKWQSKLPPKASEGQNRETASPKRETSTRISTSSRRPSSPNRISDRSRAPNRDRQHDRGFRVRTKALLEHLIATIRDVSKQVRPSERVPSHIDEDISKALLHFENEMKVLRVVFHSKDVLVDPDNALKSASRIRAPYNAAIRLCLQSGKQDRAFKLLNQMKKDGIFPSAATYSVVINGLTKALNADARAHPPHGETGQLAERKECQRIREVYQDLEKLWKQSHPQYFHRSGAPRPTIAPSLEKASLDDMSSQARRNFVSQQSSLQEAREFPKVLTNAIGSYVSFLRLIDARDELNKLLDVLFPPALVEDLAKGLSPQASPQDKLDSLNRRLSHLLPLGDTTTFSAFLMVVRDAQDPERFSTVERIWTRFQKLMELERNQRHSTASSHKREEQAAVGGSDEPRFVPDDKLMLDIFNRLVPPADADPAAELQLGLIILSSVYGLDLNTTTDGIIRDPQNPLVVEAFPSERYLSSPVLELRDPVVASSAFRLLANSNSFEKHLTLFNYLWARAYEEKRSARSNAREVGDMLPVETVFGSTLRSSNAMSVLWYCSKKGDPVGARILLAAMRRAADATSSNQEEASGVTNRRARRSRQDDGQDSVALEWAPSHTCYDRAMHAILTAVLKEPQGLTAAVLRTNNNQDESINAKYDAWAEARSLLSQWRDHADAHGNSGGTSSRTIRWDADRSHKTPFKTESWGKTREAPPDGLARIQSDTICSLFLHIARICARQEGEEGVEVARQALRLLEQRIGLVELVNNSKQLEEVHIPRRDKRATTKSHTLPQLSGIISLALDTSQRSFAPKAEVELWKRVKQLIPTASGQNIAGWSLPVKETRDKAVGGNQLLLSSHDYLELEKETEDEEIEDSTGEGRQGRGGSPRMQRRSRHVEQELERWVRGASTT